MRQMEWDSPWGRGFPGWHIERSAMSTRYLGTLDAAMRERMLAALNDDLDTLRALALAWEVSKSGLPGDVQKATLGWLDEALGLGLDAWRPAAYSVPAAVRELMEARQRARAEMRWADADALRVRIEEAGFAVRDTAAGPVAQSLTC